MNCACPNGAMSPSIPEDIIAKTEKHPCYSFGAHHNYARMHLPVAPRCNIGCNYCNRKYDCVNESRPGVTSEVLTPDLAEQKFNLVKAQIHNLSVVGIAGPGDALANWPETKKTIEAIKKADADTIFCLSTNGLMLPEYAQEIIELGINHVTVTVNCLDSEIGAKIYKFVHYKGTTYTGAEAAGILTRNQLAGIGLLTKAGVLVKVNIVMIKGVNDRHIPEVVKEVKELGAFITNIMPLIPAPGSAFENYQQTSMKELNEMRDLCGQDMRQMRHCQQCRADAIGLLGEDRSHEFCMKKQEPEAVSSPQESVKKLYKIAVTSKQGKLIDLHFGHAAEFLIYQSDGHDFKFLETRQVEKYCTGMTECDEQENKRDATVAAIADCDAVLTMRIGYQAQQRLMKQGIVSIESCYTVESGLLYAVEFLALQKAI